MPISLDSLATAALISRARGAHWLVELDFASEGTLAFTTNAVDIPARGRSYLGMGALAEVSVIGESENASAQKATLSFPLVNPAMLAAVIGNVENYRGRQARLYLQLIDATFQPVGAPCARFTGYMEPVRVTRKRQSPEGGGFTGRVEMQLSRAGMARARNIQGLRLSDAQHQLQHPGDKFYEYMTGLIEKPALWLSKRFQEQ